MTMRHIDYRELSLNPMTLFSNRWGLLCAGTPETGFNAMTIAWGHLGALWDVPHDGPRLHGRPTAMCFVRPQRHTKRFMDEGDRFSISFLPEGMRKPLAVMGTRSGRDVDKFAAAGLTQIVEGALDVAYPAEAELVFVCRKLYHADINEGGFDVAEPLETNYPKRDFHTMYIGEIEDVLASE